MANEYLQRTPTSTGNRKVWTLAFWIKRTSFATFQSIFTAANSNNVNETFLYFVADVIRLFQSTGDGSGTGVWSVTASPNLRDSSAMLHVVVSVDTTAISSDRVKIYINGVSRADISTSLTINYDTNINTTQLHRIGGRPNGIQNVGGIFSDFFFVDGEALSADVFGFNKVGKGYISVGSTQATDFRPGQWVPKSPRIIISDINNRGGFGVNGFYLPMNDSNNFGADFHCTPNSIIKLQENLPQPKSRIDGVGDYTGALREDPFKQYLVLALPFVSGGLQSGFGDYSAAIKGSGTPKTITNSNVSIASTASYYGTTGSFNGSNTYLTATMGTDLSFGTEDFTIEFWAYVLSNSSNAYIFDTNVNGMVIGYGSPAGSPSLNRWRYYNGSNGSWTLYTSNPEPVLNQWSHIALCRKNGRTTFYVNGVATSTELDSTNYTNVNSSTINIGRYGGGGIIHNGYLQDFRIYKGIGKYTGGFDVPKPYTPVGIATWRAVPDTTANNFCTWNPLYPTIAGANSTYADGNLTISETTTNSSQISATVGVSTGKWYYEAYASNTSSGTHLIGIRPAEWFTFSPQNRTSYRNNGDVYNDSGTIIQSGTTYTSNDIIGIAVDMNNRRLWFSKNGSWVYSGDPNNNSNPAVSFASTYTHYTPYAAFDNVVGTQIFYTNFGQNPTFSGNTSAGTFTDSNGKGLFKYQPPSGFLALCEDNLPTPTISDPGKHFKTVLWTGDGNKGRSITGLGFKPDLVWIKTRTNGTYYHELYDSVRMSPVLFSNATDAEITINTLNSFDNDGFTVSLQSGYNGTNQSGQNYVAWCWKAGGTTVTNTNGSITSVVSVNQDAGFSIVSYTGTGANATVGHGLGKAPSLVITKRRDSTGNWLVQHKSAGVGYLLLNSTNGYVGNDSTAWNSTFPTSSVFSISTGISGNQIAYCWAEIEGFSKFGSYVGNGSADGPFVYCGFKPAYVLVKNASSGTGNWLVWDNACNSTNPSSIYQIPNNSLVDQTTGADVDFLSNGFKVRNTSTSGNGSGNTLIFAAFAESPFQTANSK